MLLTLHFPFHNDNSYDHQMLLYHWKQMKQHLVNHRFKISQNCVCTSFLNDLVQPSQKRRLRCRQSDPVFQLMECCRWWLRSWRRTRNMGFNYIYIYIYMLDLSFSHRCLWRILWRACCRQYGVCVRQLLWQPGNSRVWRKQYGGRARSSSTVNTTWRVTRMT
jgi:hypothetical protein